jgi:hypothetical protein
MNKNYAGIMQRYGNVEKPKRNCTNFKNSLSPILYILTIESGGMLAE